MNMTQSIDNKNTWLSGFKTARCLRVVNETWDVKTFWFALENNDALSFKPGQFLSFTFNIDGKTINRCYSISSSPTQPYQFGITIKRVPGGLVSNWTHDHLNIDSKVTVAPPTGHFNCIDITAKKYLFLSGGSGITPSMSMVRWMQDSGQTPDVHFMHSARSPKDIIFKDELLQIDAKWPNFQLSTLCEEKCPENGWSGYRGRLTANQVQHICPDYKERTIMCCGPEPYMKAVRQILESIDFPMENYVEESFGAPAPSTSELSQSPDESSDKRVNIDVQLNFTTTNKQASGESKTSVLDTAQANGIWIQAGCRTGICGSCKVIKTSGSITMDEQPIGLSKEEITEGYILACCSYPQSDLSIKA